VIGIDLLRPHREAVQSDADAMRGNIQALGGPGFGGGALIAMALQARRFYPAIVTAS